MQDMSKAQLLMALAVCSGRIAGFGDRRQALFGFRGADTGSMDRIKEQLGAGELPLTITYRCAQSIVQRAQRIVPIIEAGPNNPVGEVRDNVAYSDMLVDSQPGDFILSRLNAPLVRVTLQLLMSRKKARMRGREIGGRLVSLVRRLTNNRPTMTMEQFKVRLDEWERKQVAYLLARNDREAADQERDRAAMLASFAEDSKDVSSLIRDIEYLFVDTTDEDTIICSSIHKAKGLESKTVYVLQETLYLRGVSVDEENCEYVATTRAKESLRLVYGVPGVRR
jgi:superfamily I DNA/RNA helicase